MRPPGLWRGYFLFALTLIFIAAGSGSAFGCIGTGDKYFGTLLPRDFNYHVGSNLSLQCLLNRTRVLIAGTYHTVNSSQLSFRFKNYDVPSEEVSVVNELEADLGIINASENQSGYYYCYLQIPGRQNKVLICPTIIQFGYSPANLTKFYCRSYGWRNLTCYWEAPYNPVTVNYTIGYMHSFPPYKTTMPCPWKRNRSSCQWGLGNFYIRNANKIKFKVIGNNSLGTTVQDFEFDHYSLVVPDPVTEFKDNKTLSSSIFLTWKEPAGMEGESFSPGVCYRLFYKSSYQDKPQVLEVGKSKTTFNLTGLLPYTWYSISIKARSCVAPEEEDFWSTEQEISIQTKSDIPWSPPNLSKNSFEVVNFRSRRNVTLYWQLVPREMQNAGGFRYAISFNPTYVGRRRRTINQWMYVNQSHYTFVNLDTNSAYEFLIQSANEIGLSANATRIVVDRIDKMPSRPTNIRPVSFGGGNYKISWSWSHHAKPPEAGYTLVWCQIDGPGDYRCGKHLEWKQLPGQPMEAKLTLKADHSYDFGVGAIGETGIGSGLEWAPCTVPVNRALDQVRGVRAVARSSTRIQVNWKLDCDAQKAVVLEYHIYVCTGLVCPATSCNINGTNKVISDPQADSAYVDNLLPNTFYSVSVVVSTKAGLSEESTVVCERTQSSAPSDPPKINKDYTVTNTSINFTWQPPDKPNGFITNYIFYYNGNEKQVDMHWTPEISSYNYTLEGLKCFTNYSISISACVENKYCSNQSEPIFIHTHVGAPGLMDPPRTELLNSSHVRVTWKAPQEANGPLNLYRLHLYRKEGDNVTRVDQMNVTGTSALVSLDCPVDLRTSGGGSHLFKVFKVQAVNLLEGPNDLYVYGPLSKPTETPLCFLGENLDYPLVIGIFVGATLGLALLILCLYLVVRWMKIKADKMMDFKVVLPSGLEHPYSNDINSYENFKNGLTSRGSDPNLNLKLSLNRLNSFPAKQETNDDDAFKNRHGSGASNFSAASTDELLSKHLTGARINAPSQSVTKGDRNPSGDSSSGHDSLSSSLTHRTNLSSDGSSSTTEEPHQRRKDFQSSHDSGLDEESKTQLSREHKDPESSSPSTGNYLPAAPYSKMGILESGCGYLPLSRGRHLSLYSHNLASSEPSITDLNQESLSHQQANNDPPSPDVPYSKFGLSHSVSDLMQEELLPDSPDSPPSSTQRSPQDALPYSRFGLRRPPQKSPYVTVGMALMTGPCRNPQEILSCKAPPLVLKPLQKDTKKKDLPYDLPSSDQAYSKLGLGPQKENLPLSKGYVTLQEVNNSEQQHHSLPDLTILSAEDENSPSEGLSESQSHFPEDTSKNGYLPHQMIVPVKEAEPVLPDVVNCSSILPLSVVLQETPEVNVQGNSGYVTLNQALARSTNV